MDDRFPVNYKLATEWNWEVNLILEKSNYVGYYTYLDEVFHHVPEFRQYHWLISDLECNCYPDPRLTDDPVVIDGGLLNDIIQSSKIQFIWAVFSGFRDQIQSIPEVLPYADGNEKLWVGKPRPQAVGAELEIVCWDSTCTLFINVDDRMAGKLKNLYPDIRDLNEENKKRAGAGGAA